MQKSAKLLENSSQNNFSHILAYRRSRPLSPHFQMENAAVSGRIQKDITVNFLNEFLTSTDRVKSGVYANDVEELQKLVRNLETDSVSEVLEKSSFPWHGR